MNGAPHERGQALILIVFAIVGLVGLTALAVDGGMAYSDRRNAQNAADSAALAAALGHIRGRDVNTIALAAAAAEGYDNNGTTNTVTVSVADLSGTSCPNMAVGEDITVQITSVIRTSFAPVVGIRQLTNTVRATGRSCLSYIGPLFNGNAIVALGPHGIGFDGTGNPNWLVSGGGIFSNSSDTPSARCKGAAQVSAPSLTTVGGTVMKCKASIGSTTSGTTPYTYAQYASLLPPVPTCNGNARQVGGMWVQAAGAWGSKVAFNGNMNFAPGLYCVTNSPGPYHGTIQGNGVTFFLMSTNFTMKFNGGGNLTATAPKQNPNCDPNVAGTCNPYAGVLIFSAPVVSGGVLQNTQSIDLRGNGTGAIAGSVIVPSASVTMFGNSSGIANNTQVIGYNVNSGGTTDITLNYVAADGYQTNQPAWITLLR